ncbi:hypothetical protein Poly51_53710 [Rubripirellula tenax]|uniref:Uncharacterized protein n=1 Tax=Rubripirellula tenax TaxID=2528015 RepID=A0A5C6EIV4_9BACT|nr:hypothetical protein Poly51_53710 [Rubripirellula tenax]
MKTLSIPQSSTAAGTRAGRSLFSGTVFSRNKSSQFTADFVAGLYNNLPVFV